MARPEPASTPLRAPLLRLALLSLLAVLSATALGVACGGAGDPATALRRSFPEQASRILDEGASFEVSPEGFALEGAAPASHAGLSATLPGAADGAISFELPGAFAVRVRERGLRESGAIASSAVSYARDGGTSYWAATTRGYEEWLLLESGVATGEGPVATWDIDGAAVRETGGSIELADVSGATRIVVTADVAYTVTGRLLTPRLEARGNAIELWVDADGEEVLVDPSWVAGPTLAVPRQRHTAVLLGTGKVLITGGGISNGTGSVASAELYDPATNTASPAALMKSPRSQHAMAMLANGKVLVTGGTDSNGTPLATAEIYDPAANTWTLTGSMSIPRFDHTATALANGKVLVAAGNSQVSELSSAELFDPALGTWSAAASLVGVRSRHTATLLDDGRVMVTGGYANGGYYDSVTIYDPGTNTWAPAFSLTGGRFFHAATRLPNGKVLVVGGTTTSGDVSGGAVYDPLVDFWTPTGATTAGGKGIATALLANGTVLAVGGGNPSSNAANLYDPATNTWTAAPPMVRARTHATATTLVSGSVLVAAGVDVAIATNLSSTELYLSGAPLGSPCASASECASGSCADGFCCNTACNAGVCDACSVPAGAAVNGTCALLTGPVCDDGDACTLVDACLNGVCTPASSLVCPTPTCHLPGSCDPATGVCSSPPASNGTVCDDGNACTQASTCQAGACTGQSPVVCPALDACHLQGACDPATGICSEPVKADGASCDDGDACTHLEACQSGVCVSGAVTLCAPASPCHDAGSCDPATGVCSSVPKPPGAACDDDDPCTSNDACQAGVCTGGAPVECPPADACHVGAACDPALGCPSVPKPNNTPCDDGDACTLGDSCQSGVCVGASLVVCEALDACHEAGQCDAAAGACTDPQKPDGSACPGGECVNGACEPAATSGAGGDGGGAGSGGDGGAGSGGDGGASTTSGAGGEGASSGTTTDSTCGCTMPGSPSTSRPWLALGLLLAACRRSSRRPAATS